VLLAGRPVRWACEPVAGVTGETTSESHRTCCHLLTDTPRAAARMLTISRHSAEVTGDCAATILVPIKEFIG
jgi:hypothetical protein